MPSLFNAKLDAFDGPSTSTAVIVSPSRSSSFVSKLVAFVTDYVPESQRAWLRTHGSDARVRFLDYDWSLNDLAE